MAPLAGLDFEKGLSEFLSHFGQQNKLKNFLHQELFPILK